MQQALFASNTNKADFSMREAVVGLFHQKWLIASVFMVTVLAVAVVTWLLPNRYESRMKILVKNSRANVIVSPEQTSNMALTGEVTEAQVNSEIELARSRDLLEAVVIKTGLAKQYLNKNQAESPVAVETALRQLEKDLAISPVKKANIIDVSYSSYSAQQSASVLRTLADLYLERHLHVHHIPGTEEFFKSQAVEYERQLKDAELSLAHFEAKNNIVSLPLQKEMGLRRIVDVETDFQSTIVGVLETTQRIEKIKQQLQTLDTRIPTQRKLLPYQYSIERMNTMLVELRHKRTQLLSRFQPDDRLVKEVNQQIADTEVALDKVGLEQSVEQTSDVNPLRQSLELELARAQTELTAKQSREGSLSKQLQGHRAKLFDLESTTVRHGELEQLVKELKENYQLLAKKRDESLVTAALDKQKISNVSIAETPSISSLPSGPNRKLNLLLGLFLAAFLGVGSGLGAEFLRDTVHTSRHVEVVNKYPILATVSYPRYFEQVGEPPCLSNMSFGKNEDGNEAELESRENDTEEILAAGSLVVESEAEPIAEWSFQFESEPIPASVAAEVQSTSPKPSSDQKRVAKKVTKGVTKVPAKKMAENSVKPAKQITKKTVRQPSKKEVDSVPSVNKLSANKIAKATTDKVAKEAINTSV
jgi:uncharacterized protein involved in exopolysaccharide biosynthesis